MKGLERTRPAEAAPPWIREGGFTLLEVLLAIFILAVIMSLIYGVVISTVQAQERVEEVMLASETGPALLSQIREDLESAVILKPEVESFAGSDRKASGGDRDRIDFITGRIAYGAERENEEPFFHSVNETGYQVQDSKTDPSVGVLYRREDLWVDGEPLKGGRLVELYDRVKHFNVRYWQNEKWVDVWNAKSDKGRLPRAVQIELKIFVTDRGDHKVEQSFTTTITFPR